MRRFALVAALLLLVTACGKDKAATAVSPTPTPTPSPTPAPTPVANRAPVITSVTVTPGFGLAQFTPFQLSGRATDADGDALTFNWTILSGGAVIATFTGPDVPASFQSLVRSAIARLVVTDGKGGSVTADSAAFNVGSMTATWVMTSARFPGSTMLILALQQSATGAVTGVARDTTGATIGQTDPAGGAKIDGAGNLQNLRIKFTSASNAVDFTIAGQMQSTLNVAGTISNTTATFNAVPINGLAVTLTPQ